MLGFFQLRNVFEDHFSLAAFLRSVLSDLEIQNLKTDFLMMMMMMIQCEEKGGKKVGLKSVLELLHKSLNR